MGPPCAGLRFTERHAGWNDIQSVTEIPASSFTAFCPLLALQTPLLCGCKGHRPTFTAFRNFPIMVFCGIWDVELDTRVSWVLWFCVCNMCGQIITMLRALSEGRHQSTFTHLTPTQHCTGARRASVVLSLPRHLPEPVVLQVLRTHHNFSVFSV